MAPGLPAIPSADRPVAILVALEVEARALVRHLSRATIPSPHLSVWEGVIDGTRVVLVIDDKNHTRAINHAFPNGKVRRRNGRSRKVPDQCPRLHLEGDEDRYRSVSARNCGEAGGHFPLLNRGARLLTRLGATRPRPH